MKRLNLANRYTLFRIFKKELGVSSLKMTCTNMTQLYVAFASHIA